MAAQTPAPSTTLEPGPSQGRGLPLGTRTPYACMSYAGRCVDLYVCVPSSNLGWMWNGKKDSARSRLQVITFNFYFRVFASWTKFNFTTKYALNAVAFSFLFFFIFAHACVWADFSRDSNRRVIEMGAY